VGRDVDPLFLKADELGIRLEIVRGLPTWEASPAYRHQRAVDEVRSTIRSLGGRCRCVHVADVYVRFPDGSLKRPDVSIFCREPDELDDAVTLVPAAVVEVLSPGYEAKDLQIGVGFYLSQGVKDVLVFDPRAGSVVHARRDGTKTLVGPQPFELECGCALETPSAD
jgi:Uma2 family endonuclease